MSDKDSPVEVKTSIVIPCYNEEKGVIQSLDEIFAKLNDRNDFEIIAINDGSTDKTLALVEEYSLQNPQVCIINNRINIGYGASLKKGIRQAKGKIIVITDADCTYPASRFPSYWRKSMPLIWQLAQEQEIKYKSL